MNKNIFGQEFFPFSNFFFKELISNDKAIADIKSIQIILFVCVGIKIILYNN